jgi:hypothetical protein
LTILHNPTGNISDSEIHTMRKSLATNHQLIKRMSEVKANKDLIRVDALLKELGVEFTNLANRNFGGDSTIHFGEAIFTFEDVVHWFEGRRSPFLKSSIDRRIHVMSSGTNLDFIKAGEKKGLPSNVQAKYIK